MKVKAIIERGNDGTYGVYIDINEERLTYSVLGDGDTVSDAIEDFYNSYEEMKSYYLEIGKFFQEAEFEFHYDFPSFLQCYTEYFSLVGLSRISGINKGQLSHYLTGKRNPSRRTIQKIDRSIKNFTEKLSQVEFI